MGLLVGESTQSIDVTVSTSLSEIWVVDDGGCGTSALCIQARGGVFNTSASSTWEPLGPWQLGLSYLGLGGDGDYGMDTVAAYSTADRGRVSLEKQIIAAINDTDYYNGFFGLGVTAGSFGGVVVSSPISSLVEQGGIIPSHSYGYTAGAYYVGTGMPMSLTLGGYDANRLEPHNNWFSLNASAPQPEALVRSIIASVSDVDKAPTAWSSSSIPLSYFNESVTALIDSSTPYLWLPPVICDRFAAAFNLTWNETFGLYLYTDNEGLEAYRSAPDLSLTFTLTSQDNTNDFGQPLDVAGVVNITISGDAFIQALSYPFMNLIEYEAPAVPYFPLKRAENGSQVILGRSFLQETYLITNYERSTFSVHQAKFPENPLTNTSLVTMAYTENSIYPGPPSGHNQKKGLTETQIIGIVLAICVPIIVALVAFSLKRRKRTRLPQESAMTAGTATTYYDDWKEEGYIEEPDFPRSPVSRFLSRVVNGHSKKTHTSETGNAVHEVSADASHERYELPTQLGPAELDAGDTMSSTWGTESQEGFEGKHDAYTMSSQYQERPMEIFVPQYVSGATAHRRLSGYLDNPSPTTSSTQDNRSNRCPSPMTPGSDWASLDLTSAMGGITPAQALSKSASNPNMLYTPPSPESRSSAGPDSPTRPASSDESAPSYGASLMPPQPSFQRTPIDPARVICLGPLPNNVSLPGSQPGSRAPNVSGHRLSALHSPPFAPMHRRESTTETLGSNFTIEEEARVFATGTPTNNPTLGRMDGFEDIVHVPQPARRKYSWEEER
ncbi:acid protease [Xylariaceae sp. FL0804]|nr:acid protease [Xylariaceae sp. FL0804]